MNSSPLRGVIIGFFILLSLSCVGTLGYILIEGWSLSDAFYMTVITISTVGFGETHSLSDPGKMFTCVFILAGLGTSVYTFTRLGQLIFEGELLNMIGERKMKNKLESMKDHFIICGYGRIGATVGKGLAEKNETYVVIDSNKDIIEELKEEGLSCIHGDATDEEVLKRAGVGHAATLLSMLPTDADNLYLVISAREVNSELNIIAKSMDEKGERRLLQGGASHVISPYRIASYHMLHAAISPNILKYLELGSSHDGDNVSMLEVILSEKSKFIGQSLAGAKLRNLHNIVIVAIKRADNELIVNPSASETMQVNDILVTSGTDSALMAFAKSCG